MISTMIENQFQQFPGTRYMGSKNKIIYSLWEHLSQLQFESAFDAFGGSNVVGYFLKCQGKKVITNDFLAFSYITSKAIIENSSEQLNEDDIESLLRPNKNNKFIQTTFKDIFYSEDENKFLDTVSQNIAELQNEYKSALAYSALVRACVKKRSRGIFTFVGERYNDGRVDMQKTISQHFAESIDFFNAAVFDNGFQNEAHNSRTESISVNTDLVYLDPPYFTPKSDNDYTRRYHFIEGLVKNWKGLDIQEQSVVKKFASYKSPFAKRETAYEAFLDLFKAYKNSIIAISYSSNSFPTKDELFEMLSNYKSNVVVHEIDHTYSIGNQNHKIGNKNNRVQEYLFIGK